MSSTPTTSTPAYQEAEYNYINPHSLGTLGTAQLNPVFMPRTQTGTIPPSGSPRTLYNNTLGQSAAALGVPASPYPTAPSGEPGTGPTAVTQEAIPTPAVREHVEIVKAEILEEGQHGQLLLGSERDRNLYFVVTQSNPI